MLAGYVILAILSAISLSVLILTGVFSAKPLTTAPVRRNTLDYLFILFVLMLYFFFTFLSAPVALHFMPMVQAASLADVIGRIAAVAAIFLVCSRFFENGISGLGASVGLVPKGIVVGALSFVAITPILYSLLAVTEALATHITHKMPPVHPMLKALATDHSATSLAFLSFLIVVAAPISEELFFRGLIQSWLGQKLAFLAARAAEEPADGTRRPAIAQVIHFLGAVFTSTRHASAVAAEEPAANRRPTDAWIPRNRWIAILITATLFSGMHFAVAKGYDEYFPVLFLLGVALGYIYERTGNIWTDITMHACFNLIPTVLILCGVKPK